MQPSDDLLTVFTADITSQDGRPVVGVPERELAIGDLEIGETYRVAILPQKNRSGTADSDPYPARQQTPDESTPPVEEGETLNVEIEDVGDQGDGLARIGPGYVVFVPDTSIGDRVTIKITQARESFGFAEVVEHEPVSE